jgi:hypothetical protein
MIPGLALGRVASKGLSPRHASLVAAGGTLFPWCRHLQNPLPSPTSRRNRMMPPGKAPLASGSGRAAPHDHVHTQFYSYAALSFPEHGFFGDSGMGMTVVARGNGRSMARCATTGLLPCGFVFF